MSSQREFVCNANSIDEAMRAKRQVCKRKEGKEKMSAFAS